MSVIPCRLPRVNHASIAVASTRFSTVSFGIRIGLDEVEAVFRSRGVSAAAAGDDNLLAVLLVNEGGTLDADTEADRLAAAINLPLSAINVSLAREIPRLPSGKPDYAAILAAARTAQPQSVAAQGADVARLFAGAFPRATISDGSSFTTLGGDSLNYVTLSVGLERALGRLPARWEEMSVAELRQLAPDGSPPHRRWWQGRSIESEVVIRALAILAVVLNHASDRWTIGGGADVLLMLFGYNLSRYQLTRLARAHPFAVLRDFGLRIILPFYLFLLAWSAAKRSLDLPSLLLVSNFWGRFGSLMEPYWFLEVLWQIMILVTIVAAVSPLRRAIVTRPWESGLAMLAIGLTVALVLNLVWPRPELQFRTPELLFWLVGLGWAMHRAGRAPRRIAVVVTVILAILTIGLVHPFGLELGYPDGRVQRVWFAASCFLILFLPRLTFPAVLVSTVATIASASFYIYLTHIVPIHVLRHVLHLRFDVIVSVAGLIPGIAIGLLLQGAWRHRGRASVPA